MKFNTERLLRTPHSERHLILDGAQELGALDLHYLLDGRVAGTLTLFEQSKFPEDAIPTLLEYVDRVLLPEVSMEEGTFSVTVVRGKIIGNFVPDTARKTQK